MEPSSKPADAQPSTMPKKRGKGLWIGIGAVVVIVIVVAGLYFAGYFSGTTVNVSVVDDAKCTPTGDTACAFSPTNYNAKVGDTVVWKNNGSVDHTVTASPNSTATWTNASNSGQTVSSGTTVSVKFSAVGTYSYYCTIHNWMKGTITVSY